MSPDVAYMILHSNQSSAKRQQSQSLATVAPSQYGSLIRITLTAVALVFIFIVAGCNASAQDVPNFQDSEQEAQFVEAGFEHGCPPYFCG